MNTKLIVKTDRIEFKDYWHSSKRRIQDVNSSHGKWKASDYRLYVCD